MKALSLLIKPASGSCNMRCAYCFYDDVGDSRQQKARGMMSLDTLERVVRAALLDATHHCTFGFQGGEPTLRGLPFFRALIEFQRRHNVHRTAILNTLQTNGLLIDGEWAAFLAEHRFLTGLSIDGPKDVHDALRHDHNGKGTHTRALGAARALTRAGAAFNVLSVVTRDLAAHPDAAHAFYRKQGFRHIQYIPCLDALDGGAGDGALDPALYGRFLMRTFDLWHRDYMAGAPMSIRAFDNYITMLMGLPPESCAMAGRCSASLVVEADGEVYPCDFYALDEHRLGNLREDGAAALLSCDAARAFVAPSLQPHEDCLACPYLPICRGGCRRDRERLPDGALGANRFCEAYKMLFDHALPRMRRVAAQELQRRPLP